MEFPKKKYQIIYADPPWDSGQLDSKSRQTHYNTLSIQEIKDLTVNSLALDDCILFLWVVDCQLIDALEVIKAWGFIYKTVAFTWVKATRGGGRDHFGAGQWTRKNPEMCLLATKGKPHRISAKIRQLQWHRIAEHSKKPDAIRAEIVKLCGDLPRIELFSRYKIQGWDCWGNEVPTETQTLLN